MKHRTDADVMGELRTAWNCVNCGYENVDRILPFNNLGILMTCRKCNQVSHLIGVALPQHMNHTKQPDKENQDNALP